MCQDLDFENDLMYHFSAGGCLRRIIKYQQYPVSLSLHMMLQCAVFVDVFISNNHSKYKHQQMILDIIDSNTFRTKENNALSVTHFSHLALSLLRLLNWKLEK